MNQEEKKITKTNNTDLTPADDEFEIPYEAACSPEFSEGCVIAEEETD
jgi:hypothetical protein